MTRRQGQLVNALVVALLVVLCVVTALFGSAGFKLACGVIAGVAGLGLFLGGLLSAALEIRQERAAGKHVTRPGWDSLRGYWKGLRTPRGAHRLPPLEFDGVPIADEPDPYDCDHGELAPYSDPEGVRTGEWYCADCFVIVLGPRSGRLVPYDGL